ncbi:MAG: FIG01144323: hypothetical protein [uncultured Sulfurovum sp.]|uniref:Outer membrane porin, OprD family n=1 Tax=uncultured Sulfurovum sp. TaxID=269237 RepID=A0A6S6U0L8_9BACT|nr:MAG: FIG01144323: hypothetical protein [uncultured Sulfurovum sp.]
MKKLTFSMVTIGLLSSSAVAADTLADAFKDGKTSGQIRSFYIDRERAGTHATSTRHNKAWAAGGHLKFETAPINGLSLGTALYTTNGIFGLNSPGEAPADRNPTLFGEGAEGYSILGEAYLQYKTGKTAIKVGRQKLNTPFLGTDDARMLPNLSEAGILTNTDVENTKIFAGHVSKMAYGTFSNAYGPSSQLGLQGGYGLNNTSNKFINIGNLTAGGKDTAGVSIVSATYTGVPGLKLQAWDYMAHDILNTIYLQGDYGFAAGSAKMKVSAQAISQSDMGDKLLGDVDSKYVAAKLGGSTGALSAYVAYSTTGSHTGTTTNTTNGGVVAAWGGIPAFTQGMVTRHMFFADTDTTKVAATYNFKNTGTDVKATGYYASFDVGANSTVGANNKATESGFDIQYNPAGIKNLNLRLRANYPRDFVSGLDWDEYRIIANYNF